MVKIKKVIVWGLIVSICTLFVLIGYIFNVFSSIENIFYDLRFKIHGPVKKESNVVIIKIDEESLSHLGRWPWDRKIIAKVVENLFNAGVKVVALDILFPEQSNIDSDRALYNSLKKGESIIAYHFEYVYENILKNGIVQKIQTEKIIYPIKLFKEVAKIGFTNIEPDDDGVVRSITLYKYDENKQYFSFSYLISESIVGKEKLKDIPQKIYINYYGPSEFFDKKSRKIVSRFVKYSFVNIYKNIIPSIWLKDKIALIGSTATGSYDHYPTPFIKTFPGVELHATVVENLISKTYCTKKFNKFHNIIFIAIISILLSVIFYKTSASLILTIMVLFIIGYYFLTYLFFFKFYIILEYAPYFVNTFLLGFVCIFYNLLSEQKEKKLIKNAFSRYINPYVMEELLKNPHGSLSSLGGQKREITVVFTDIRKFTTLSEKLPADELVKFLNKYFQAMNNIIFKYNGTIDKYIGDAIMFFWNAPLDQPDHAYLAVKCVIEMLEEFEKFSQTYNLPNNFKIKIGAGINTGEAVVGNIGSSQLMEYTAIGDTVNIASRLQDLTKDFNSPIIISEFTNKKLNNRIPTTSLGKIKLRGKDQEIEIFKVGDYRYN